MVDEKRQRIHPHRLVEQGAILRGTTSTALMHRLADAVVEVADVADYDLTFGRNAAERPSVEGNVATEVTVTCQRCMGEMRLRLAGEVRIELVPEADEEAREEGYETWVVTAGADLAEMVETELLLALPFAPAHADGCELDEQYVPQAAAERRESPFAGLKGLMND